MIRVPYYYYLSLVGFMPKLSLELRGLKIFMANEVRRIIKQACGAPALTKDSLLFVSLQTNQ
jgi:hypothetical protein